MKICFPVRKDDGVESRLYDHFGSAPMFVVFDNERNTVTAINNYDRQHGDRKCSPLSALEGHSVDCVVANTIGEKALLKLHGAGITVYRAMTDNVKENIMLFQSVGLPVFRPELVCARHKDSCTNH